MESLWVPFKEKQMVSYVGIDVGKRSISAVRLSDGSKADWLETGTSAVHIDGITKWLRTDDIIALEAGNLAFRLTRKMRDHGHTVHVLNPSDLATIYASLKKTDREDALKLARLIQRIPSEELPTVTVPSVREEMNRRLVTEHEHWVKSRTKSINRLHALFVHAGITHLKRTSLLSRRNRDKAIADLDESFQHEAVRLKASIDNIETALAEISDQIQDQLKSEKAYSQLAMSMPGLGPQAAFTLMAFINRGQRFSYASQVSYYAGLVPRVDISGSTVRHGRIVKRGCRPIKRVITQCAWGLIRARHGGPLKDFYTRLYVRIGKKKAVVAVARKMIETFFIMLRTGEFYRGVPPEIFQKKLQYYGLT
jgi:transposase